MAPQSDQKRLSLNLERKLAMKKESNHQGDVYVKVCEKAPSDLKKVERENGAVVLAHGDVTGHKHQFKEDHVHLYVANDNRRFLVIKGKPATLFHEEHASIEFAPGEYEVFIAREWTDEHEPRQVMD